MKKMLAFGDRYAKQSTWKDFAMVKLCLFSMGVVVGTLVSEQYRKVAVGISICVFAATYIPLIVKTIRVARERD